MARTKPLLSGWCFLRVISWIAHLLLETYICSQLSETQQLAGAEKLDSHRDTETPRLMKFREVKFVGISDQC